MTAGIILAGGKGSRFGGADKNKTANLFSGKPMVRYGVELLAEVTDKIVVVVGVMAETVKDALAGLEVEYAVQPEPKGTGDATIFGVKEIVKQGWKVDNVIVGYGDHMMFYHPQTMKRLLAAVESPTTAVAMITTRHSEPDKLAWGRVVRNSGGEVVKIVEQKDASAEERQLEELNAGCYSFNFGFLREHIGQIPASPVSGEYYLTDMVELAIQHGKRVAGVEVPTAEVGMGVNTQEELKLSEKLYSQGT